MPKPPKVGCNFGGMFALGILILLFFDAEVENGRVVSIERVDRQYGQKVFFTWFIRGNSSLGVQAIWPIDSKTSSVGVKIIEPRRPLSRLRH